MRVGLVSGAGPLGRRVCFLPLSQAGGAGSAGMNEQEPAASLVPSDRLTLADPRVRRDLVSRAEYMGVGRLALS